MGGWKRLSGNLRSAFREPRNADVIFDEVIERFQILVAQRPVLAIAIVRGGLEVEIAESITLARPDVGTSAHDAHPSLPAERLVLRRRVRLLEIVREPVVVVFGAGVALNLARTRPADDLRRTAAIPELELGLVTRERGHKDSSN